MTVVIYGVFNHALHLVMKYCGVRNHIEESCAHSDEVRRNSNPARRYGVTRGTEGRTSADDTRGRGGCFGAIAPASRTLCVPARVRFIVWCIECRYQAEPDPAEMARRHGSETPVADWHKRLVCSRCGSHDTDMVVSGERR